MKVKDVMHRSVDSAGPSTTISEIAQKMREEDVGAITVLEQERLVGIITDRDIACRAFVDSRFLQNLEARHVMSAPVLYCQEEDELQVAVQRMEHNNIRRLPVIDEKKRMVGMLTLADISHVSKSAAADVILAVSKRQI
jgi:CBS domain-containing protein